jgi:tRNA(Arg) A34 adenosine deaminase TadA
MTKKMTRPHDAGSHSQPLPNLLSPCPFCRGAVTMHQGHADITYFCCDDGCGAVVSFRPNLKGSPAIAKWNTREQI